MKNFHQHVISGSQKVASHMKKHHKKYVGGFFAGFAVVKMAKLFAVAAGIVIGLINTQNISAQESGGECTVTFDSNRGTVVPSQTVISGSTGVLPTAPELPGYEFSGWYTECTGGNIFDFTGTAITGDITLCAKWEYTGVIADLDVYFVKDDGEVEHHTFMDRNLGASTTGGGTGASKNSYGFYYQRGNNYGFANTGNINVSPTQVPYDVWSQYIPSKYASGVFVTGNSGWMLSGSNIGDLWGGETNTLEAMQGPCPDGYHVPTSGEWTSLYNHWIGQVGVISNTGNQWSQDFLMPFAGYRARHDARAIYNDGWYWSNQQYDYSRNYYLRNNYFDSYPSYLTYDVISNTQGMSIRCFKNEKNTGLTINPNSGTGVMIIVHSGIITKLGEPTNNDNFFVGWYTDSNFDNPVDIGESIDMDDTTLYAKRVCSEENLENKDEMNCIEEKHNVVYSYPTGQTGVEVYYGSTIIIPGFDRTGYIFSGWKIEGDNNIYHSGDSYTVVDDVIFLIQYTCDVNNGYFINKDEECAKIQCKDSWENDNFLDENFWQGWDNLSDIEKRDALVCALYGSGGEDQTAYTIGWSLSNTPCPLGEMAVIETGILPNNLSKNTIYVLNTGKVITTSGVDMASCSAIVSRSGTTLYSNAALLYSPYFAIIYVRDSRNNFNNILDNISIDGTHNGKGGTHGANLRGIFLGPSSMRCTFNNVKVYNNKEYGINIYGNPSLSSSYRSYRHVLNNIQSYNNGINGINLEGTNYISINNSQIYNNGDAGIKYYSTSQDNVLNNIQIYNNSGVGISSGNAGFLYVSGILLYNNNGGNGNWDVSFDLFTNPKDEYDNYLLSWSGNYSSLKGKKNIGEVVGYSYGSGVLTQVQPMLVKGSPSYKPQERNDGNKVITGGSYREGYYIGSNVKKVSGNLEMSDVDSEGEMTVTGSTTSEGITRYSVFGNITHNVIGNEILQATEIVLTGGEEFLVSQSEDKIVKSLQKRVITQIYGDDLFATHFVNYDNEVPLVYYTVVFDPGRGFTVGSNQVLSGDYRPSPIIDFPGYMLSGWYFSGTDDLFDLENTPITGNIELYAKWKYTGEIVDLDVYFLTPMGEIGQITLMDRNVGATTTGVWIDASSDSYGYYYNRGNNQGTTNLSDDIPSGTWVSKDQGPCPDGYYVPTYNEWMAVYDNFSGSTNYKENIGKHLAEDFFIPFVNQSTKSTDVSYYGSSNGDYIGFKTGNIVKGVRNRISLFSVRCFKNEVNTGLTVYPDGGTGALIIVYNGVITQLEEPNKAGSLFDGWYKDSGFANKVEIGYAIDMDNATLYAKWKYDPRREVRILSNNTGYGNVSTGSLFLTGGVSIDFNDNVLMVGDGEDLIIVTGTAKSVDENFFYSFSGWNFSQECMSGDSYVVASGCVITGEFIATNRYTVTFDANRGTIVNFEKVVHGEKVSQPETELPGYRLVGWYSSCIGESEKFDFDTPITGNLDLCARWEYTGKLIDLDVYFIKGDGTTGHTTMMDRNMGASTTGAGRSGSIDSYGFYYQWGNNYGFKNTGSVNITTNRVSVPGKYIPSKYASKFFVYYAKNQWYMGTPSNLWGGTSDDTGDRQGPCPDGYHIPTNSEWISLYNDWLSTRQEIVNTGNQWSLDFRMPLAGIRDFTSETTDQSWYGRYRSSTMVSNNPNYVYSFISDPNSIKVGWATDTYGTDYGYSLRCFKNEINTGLTIDSDGGTGAIIAVHSGVIVKLGEPTKADRVFSGWYSDSSFENKVEIGDTINMDNATLYAKWTCVQGHTLSGNECTINQYTVTFVDEDGTELEKDENVAYGTMPSYDGETPTKAVTAQYTYTFAGWSPELVAVTGDATYTATFDSEVNEYTITWKNDDGSIIDTTTVEYGTVPTHADATKANTAQYTYTFAGWSPQVHAVDGPQEYIATYTDTTNTYAVTIATIPDGYGTVSTGYIIVNAGLPITPNNVGTLAIGGTMVTTIPETNSVAGYLYEFSGWINNCGDTVTNDCTITAVFREICDINYTYNGISGLCEADTQTASCEGDIPVHATRKPGHGTFIQTWDGSVWDPASVLWVNNGSVCGFTCDTNYVFVGDSCELLNIIITGPESQCSIEKTVSATSSVEGAGMWVKMGLNNADCDSSTFENGGDSYNSGDLIQFISESDSGTYVCFKASTGGITVYSGVQITDIDKVGPTTPSLQLQETYNVIGDTYLSWSDVEDNGCGGLSGYNYILYSGNTCEGTVLTGGVTPHNITGFIYSLEDNREYCLAVYAEDTLGNTGEVATGAFDVNTNSILCSITINPETCTSGGIEITLTGEGLYYSWTGFGDTGDDLTKQVTANGIYTGFVWDDGGHTGMCHKTIDNYDDIVPNIISTVFEFTGYECEMITGIVEANDGNGACSTLTYIWNGQTGFGTGYGIKQDIMTGYDVFVSVTDLAGNMTGVTIKYEWFDKELRMGTGIYNLGWITGDVVEVQIEDLTASGIFDITGYGSCETVTVSSITCVNATGVSEGNTGLKISFAQGTEGTGSCMVVFTDGDTTATGEIVFDIDTKRPMVEGGGLTGGYGSAQCINQTGFVVTGIFSEAMTGVELSGTNVQIVDNNVQGQTEYVWTVTMLGGEGKVRLVDSIVDMHGNTLSGDVPQLILGNYDNERPDKVTLDFPSGTIVDTGVELVWNAASDNGCVGNIMYSYVVTGDDFEVSGTLNGTSVYITGLQNGKTYRRNVWATDGNGNSGAVSETREFVVNTGGVQCRITPNRDYCASGDIVLTLAGSGNWSHLSLSWTGFSNMISGNSLTKTVSQVDRIIGYVQAQGGKTGYCEITADTLGRLIDSEDVIIGDIVVTTGYECETITGQVYVQTGDTCGKNSLDKFSYNWKNGAGTGAVFTIISSVATGYEVSVMVSDGAGNSITTGYRFEWLNSPVTATGFTVDLAHGNTVNWKQLSHASDGACGSNPLTATASSGSKGECRINEDNLSYVLSSDSTGSDSCVLTISDDDGGNISVVVTVILGNTGPYVELISPEANKELDQGNVTFVWAAKAVPADKIISGYRYQVGTITGFVNTTGVTLNLPAGTYSRSVAIEYADGTVGGYSDLRSVKMIARSSGGGGRLVKDHCPGGDNSDSYYDGVCDNYNPQKVANVCGVNGSHYTDEQKGAYLYAYVKGLTTQCPISEANLNGHLHRDEFAKIISVYAINVVGREPDYGKAGCDKFSDVAGDTSELQSYMKLACELELMGMESDGVTPKKYFDPYSEVTRAEFGTVFSRLLFGDMYNVKNESEVRKQEGFWYKAHLAALKDYGIMTKVDGVRPEYMEYRGWSLIMLQRADYYGVFQGKSPAKNGINALFTKVDNGAV